jgi:membrane protein YdbS with pleckstrin-like domain
VEPFDPADVTWQRVSPRLAIARRVLLTALAAVVVAGCVVMFALSGDGWVLVGVPLVLLAAGWAWWVVGRQTRAIGYAEREDDLLVRRGVMFRNLVVVPYGRMQYVDVTAGLLEQWLGVATVRLHTAAAATDARIPGLPASDAAVLRDRLAQKGESRSIGL